MAETITRRGWMLCDESSQPSGPVYDTEAEAQHAKPPLYYHVRPVDMEITVRGAPPAPWCFRAVRAPATAKGGDGNA